MSAAIVVDIEDQAWLTAMPDILSVLTTTLAVTLETACPALRDTALADGAVSVLLTDNESVRTLNRTWRDQDKATNVLSFPAQHVVAGTTPQPEFDGVPLMLGDIALAYQVVDDEARQQSKNFADHARHLAVHGLLHLLGYDHETEAEAAIMETLEIRILAGFDIADPYSADRVDPQ